MLSLLVKKFKPPILNLILNMVKTYLIDMSLMQISGFRIKNTEIQIQVKF